MSVIINIDTATATARVSVAKNGLVLQEAVNIIQTDHAGFLQVAVKEIINKAGIGWEQVDAIAVTIGPGSYTGLRVGLASAKGLCYALNKPLITIGTLEVLAASAIKTAEIKPAALLCPMIDARRMEVFTAVFDQSLHTVLSPCALVLDAASFAGLLDMQPIVFFGNGSTKWQNICEHHNAQFIDIDINSAAMNRLSANKYNNRSFADLAYTEPTYIKEFHFNTI